MHRNIMNKRFLDLHSCFVKVSVWFSKPTYFVKVSVWFSKPTFHLGHLVVTSMDLLKAGWKLLHSGFACTYSNYNSSRKLYLFHHSHKIMNQLCGSFSNGWIGKDHKYVQHSILPKLLPKVIFHLKGYAISCWEQ